jgi:AcrR family transcriptional regulator
MARPSLTEDQRDKMRERIRTEALYLYRQGGTDAISVRAVAQRVGVAASSIYSFYQSRQSLIESLWSEPVLTAISEMVCLAQVTPDPIERLRGLLLIYLKLAEDNPEIYRAAFMYVRADSLEPPKAKALNELPFYSLMFDSIKEAQGMGQFRQGDASLMAQALWAGVHGAVAISTNIEHWAFSPSSDLAHMMIDLLVDGLKQ